MRLARLVGCDDGEVRDVLYTSLLQHVGCTASSYENARTWGDDVGVNRAALLSHFADRTDALRTFFPGIAERTGASRVRTFATGLALGQRTGARALRSTCEVAGATAQRLDLSDRVRTSLSQTVAWWNGKGYPALAGEQISLVTRIMHIASTAVLYHLHAGPESALAEVRRRSGGYLDPGLVPTFLQHGRDLLGDLVEIDGYQEVLAAEPDPVCLVDNTRLEVVAAAFGDLVDLKCPALHGHSAGVAVLVADAASTLGLDDKDVRTARVAGYLHDLGRVAVSSRIWGKPGPLTATEQDQARLHPYYSERILARVPALTEVARVVGQHHERCDGSGYHRGCQGSQLSAPARLLGAADAYRSLVEERPYRLALPAAGAADALRSEVRAGRLDGDAVAAVLTAAGEPTRVRRARPAGLTDRQVQVLNLLAQGLSNRAIAGRLVISKRTAEHHVQDIYLKIGASTRAAAALFAMEHGLLNKSG